MNPARALIQKLISKPVGRDLLVMYAVQISGYMFPLITLPYLARVLNPDKFGLLAFAQGIMYYFVTLTEYSFNLTATRRAALVRDDSTAVSRLFSVVAVSKLILLAAGLAILCAVVAATPRFRPEWLLFLACYLAVAGYAVFPLWLYQGLQRMQHIGVRDLLGKVLTLACVFAFVRDRDDYVLAAAIQGGGLFVSGLVGLALVPRFAGVRFQWPGWSAVAQELKDGRGVFLSSTMGSLVVTTNIFILGITASPVAVGLFSAAFRVSNTLRALVMPLVSALYPYACRMSASNPAHLVRFLRRYSLLMSSPFLAAGVVMAVGAPYIVGLMFGPEYRGSVPLLQIMAFIPFVASVQFCFSTYYLLGLGYMDVWARITRRVTLTSFLLLGILMLVFRPEIAVAISLLAGDTLALAAAYAFYLRTARRHLDADASSPAAEKPLHVETAPS